MPAAFATASQAMRTSASRTSGLTVTPCARSSSTSRPSRAATSSVACASTTSSGSSAGRVSAAIARRESSSARSRRRRDRGHARPVGRGEAPRAAHDVGQLLRDAVVQVARDPPPLLEHRGLREVAPVPAHLARGADEQRQVEEHSEDVAGVDPVRVEGRVEEVVQARESGEQRRGGEPAVELVVRAVGAPGEAERRRGEQRHGEELHGQDGDVAVEVGRSRDRRTARSRRRPAGGTRPPSRRWPRARARGRRRGARSGAPGQADGSAGYGANAAAASSAAPAR